MKTTAKLAGIITYIIFLIIIGPLLSIWAWNTLFGSLHAIPYSLETWAAVGLLFSAVKYKG
jgi:hypothetical protein